MFTITIILTLFGTSLALPMPGYYLGHMVPCKDGVRVSRAVEQCADELGMAIPKLANAEEKEFASLCRLIPPRDTEDFQTKALHACAKELCPPNFFLESFIKTTKAKCHVILATGCPAETLNERLRTCVPEGSKTNTISEAGLAMIFAALMDPADIPCAIYTGFGSQTSTYQSVRYCIAKKCPYFPDPDLKDACPVKKSAQKEPIHPEYVRALHMGGFRHHFHGVHGPWMVGP